MLVTGTHTALSVQVLIAPDVLQAWTEECTPHRNLDLPSNASALKLFSSNDYMGLSSHPAVARAAADAVLRHGMGASCKHCNAFQLIPQDSLTVD